MNGFLKRIFAPENLLIGIATILMAIFMAIQISISDDIASISKNATRPYLIIDDIELKRIKDTITGFGIGKKITVTFTIKNKGQTPAYEVIDSLRVDILHPDIDLPMPPHNWSNQYIVGNEIKRFKQSQRVFGEEDVSSK